MHRHPSPVSAVTEAALTIVGAGPAGLAAAIQAARLGLDVTVVDEQLLVGGQVYRQPPESFTVPAPAASRESGKARALFAQVEQHRARLGFRLDALVWGAAHTEGQPGATLSFTSAGRCGTLRTETLILATGATERVYPFPGWTLPGVYTAGAVQILLKSQFVLPGSRIVVAGTGPLLLVLAEQLHSAGAQVVAILELAAVAAGWRRLHKWRGNLGLLAEGLGLHWRRVRAGIPFRQRMTILEARSGAARGDNPTAGGGTSQVREIVIGPVDAAWRPLAGRRETLAVDAVAVSHGFVSNSELALLIGCEHRYDEERGGWVPLADERQETTVPGVFTAGDCAGVAGSAVAQVEGALAALGAGLRLKRLGEPEHRALAAPLLAELRRLTRFREFLDPLSRFRPGLLEVCTPETLVCRCEGVTRAEIERAVACGYTHQLSLKLKTRTGMGLCQGRMCRPALAQLMARALGCSPAESGLYHPRAPVRPVPLKVLAGEERP